MFHGLRWLPRPRPLITMGLLKGGPKVILFILLIKHLEKQFFVCKSRY